MVDIEGKKLEVGDKVIKGFGYMSNVMKCEIVGFTPKGVRLKVLTDNWIKGKLILCLSPNNDCYKIINNE